MEIKFFKPTVKHIKQMQELVKPEVDNGNILLRTEDEMANTIRSYTVVTVDNKLAGFTALHIHSCRLAEVRSLIISKEFRGLKLGKKLVEACIEEGKKYELEQILSLTYEQGFFESVGFRKIEKENIPEHKIWADCIRCKHFPICDEIAMVYDL
ncbi:GNAT family N-acetyltransferase [Malaciobacter halophilus]|uniref:GNAT family N-acetyltransferase n=1 Tax=Malaciobacter halophilus TaxID=197482 RepID=A0A2N1J6M3_9BACT|nr:N-acetyltransferase [Malaciobacter halophilus]AXH09986.1 acetyltransferase [Malaciobacter halophilus]PKI82203.1 GNAT family N-acetyltransferase [Malaciobacter halophilus]